jgi:hypothetical protein
MPENEHLDDAAPTMNQSKAPTSQPAAAPTVLFTNHIASEASLLYSTGGDAASVEHTSAEVVKDEAQTAATEESHPWKMMRDVYPVHSRKPSWPGGVLTGGAGGDGGGDARAGGLGGVGGTGGFGGGDGGGDFGVGSTQATRIPVSSSTSLSALKNVNLVSVLRKPMPRLLYLKSGAMRRVEITLS